MKQAFIAAIVLAAIVNFAPRGEAQQSTRSVQDGAQGAAQLNRQPASRPNDAEHPAAITKTTENQPPQWYQSPEWVLVIVGIITCLVIGWQSWATYQAADATRKSVELQEAQLQQWLDLEDFKSFTDPRYTSGMAETRLVFGFKIVNPTKMQLTLEWVIVRFLQERQDSILHDTLTPDNAHPFKVFTVLRDKAIENYGNGNLVLAIVITVGYTDAFGRPQKHRQGMICRFGPPNDISFAPYSGKLPEDEIAKKSGPDDNLARC